MLFRSRAASRPLSDEQRAGIADFLAKMPESVIQHTPWIRDELAEDRVDVPVWPSVNVGKGDDASEYPAGRRLLDADPGAIAHELLRVHRTHTPHRWHYFAAVSALRREGADITPETRNVLAEALRAECCRLRFPEAAGLDELNTIATEAIERVSGEHFGGIRAKVRERPLF